MPYESRVKELNAAKNLCYTTSVHEQHLVRLLGVYDRGLLSADVSNANPRGLVFEYCAGGDLKQYLEECYRTLPFDRLFANSAMDDSPKLVNMHSRKECDNANRDSGLAISPFESEDSQSFSFGDNGMADGWENRMAKKLILFSKQIASGMVGASLYIIELSSSGCYGGLSDPSPAVLGTGAQMP